MNQQSPNTHCRRCGYPLYLGRYCLRCGTVYYEVSSSPRPARRRALLRWWRR